MEWPWFGPRTSTPSTLLLQAASGDKRFVVEAAEAALQELAGACSPARVCDALGPYCTAHKNPKVRGKAAAALAPAAQCRAAEGGREAAVQLLPLVGPLISDNTPEARDAARAMATGLRAAFGEDQDGWAKDCQSLLGAKAAAVVLKSTATS